MIIQHYDFEVREPRAAGLLAATRTSASSRKDALANQVGIRRTPGACRRPDGDVRAGPAPDRRRPSPTPMLRMVDRIDLVIADGGPTGSASSRAERASNPEAWFFKAHFYQDPVWPGSLGWNRSCNC